MIVLYNTDLKTSEIIPFIQVVQYVLYDFK